MSFRVVAVLAAAAIIVIAFAAVLVATHHTTKGMVPAGPDQNTKAYWAMNSSDLTQLGQAASQHCGTITDTGCPAALARLEPAVQHWLAELKAFQTPSKLRFLDAELRRHLSESIAAIHAVASLQAANNKAGFDVASAVLNYEGDWILGRPPVALFASPSYAASYAQVVAGLRSLLDEQVRSSINCGGGFGFAPTESQVLGCLQDVSSAEIKLSQWVGDLVDTSVPSAKVAAVDTIEADLGQADSALEDVNDAMLSGRLGNPATGIHAYVIAINTADWQAGDL